MKVLRWCFSWLKSKKNKVDKQSVSVTDSLCLSQTLCVCHRNSVFFTASLCLSIIMFPNCSWIASWLNYSCFCCCHDLSVRFVFVCHYNPHDRHFLAPKLGKTYKVNYGYILILESIVPQDFGIWSGTPSCWTFFQFEQIFLLDTFPSPSGYNMCTKLLYHLKLKLLVNFKSYRIC